MTGRYGLKAELLRGRLVIGLAVALVGCTRSGLPSPAGSGSDGSPSPTPPSLTFAFDGAEPVVTRQLTGFDESYINPGAVIEDAGVLHMFANVFSEWPGRMTVAHLTSTDGIDWTLASPDPVLTNKDVRLANPGFDVSTGFIAEDGTWVLIFEQVSASEPWSLGRATAPGPNGPWTVERKPILEPGPEGSFDGWAVAWPSVIRTDAGYFLYYTAAPTQFGDTTIGMATSSDGMTWEKQAEPVLVADREWEHGKVDRPRAVVVGDRIAMVYSGGVLTDRGLAWSEDGISWTKDGGLPVITNDSFPVEGRAGAWDAALIERDGQLVYYLEIGVAVRETGTQVYRATADPQ